MASTRPIDKFCLPCNNNAVKVVVAATYSSIGVRMKITKILSFLVVAIISSQRLFCTTQSPEVPVESSVQAVIEKQVNKDAELITYNATNNEIKIGFNHKMSQDPVIKSVLEKYKNFVRYDEENDELVVLDPLEKMHLIENVAYAMAGAFCSIAGLALMIHFGQSIRIDKIMILLALEVFLVLITISHIKDICDAKKGILILNPQRIQKYSDELLSADFDMKWKDLAKLNKTIILFQNADQEKCPVSIEDAHKLIIHYFEKYGNTKATPA